MRPFKPLLLSRRVIDLTLTQSSAIFMGAELNEGERTGLGDAPRVICIASQVYQRFAWPRFFSSAVPPRTCLWKRDTADCISRINIGSAIDNRALVSNARIGHAFRRYYNPRSILVHSLYLNDNNNGGTRKMASRQIFLPQIYPLIYFV